MMRLNKANRQLHRRNCQLAFVPAEAPLKDTGVLLKRRAHIGAEWEYNGRLCALTRSLEAAPICWPVRIGARARSQREGAA